MSKKKKLKVNIKLIKDICTIISGLTGIILVIFQFQPYLSLNELNTLLFIVGFSFLTITIYLIIINLRTLIASILNGRLDPTNLIRYIGSLGSFSIIAYFLINRSYFFLSYFFINLIYIPILSLILLLIIYSLSKHSKFRKVDLLWKKIIIILSIIAGLSIPFFFGASNPQLNPNVEISPKPMELSYEKGNQVQDVKGINVYVKSLEGIARNINISIQTPINFYYWVDGIQNDTKFLSFLNYDEVNHFLLEIQPSITIGNGTYSIKIKWSYEGDMGTKFFKSINLHIFIGTITPEFPTYILIIILTSAASASILIVCVRKKKKIQQN